jgi:RecA-family ATPase
MADQFEYICEVVEARTGLKPVNAGHNRRKGLCPAHPDDKPSLSLRKDEANGKIGVTCFAGCTFDEICEELELTARDFRLGGGGRRGDRTRRADSSTPTGESSKKGSPQGREIERYAYTDEEGRVLYYNVRFEPKDFRMADRTGKLASLPKNMKWVPYNLPEVVAAVEQGRTIYWVEGERDVHSLRDRGEVATTNAGGANRPMDPEWAGWFEGARIVIVCDKDKPGRAYGRAVARLLVNKVDSLEIRESATPQAKSDVTDHLQAGYQLNQLDLVPMRSVRRTRWTLAHLMSTPPEPLRWVYPGVVPEGLSLLVGAPKVGKSWININLMAALGSGDPHSVFDWGQRIDPSPNLYLALEDPHRRVFQRMRQVTKGLRFDPALAGDVWLDLPAIEKGGKDEIERWLDNHPTARVVLVDVLAKVRGGGDPNAGMYQADYAAVSILKEIADDYGIGVVVTHHDRKKGDEDFLNMVSGTKGVTGAADTILYLTRERGSTSGLLRVESRDVEECQYRMEFVRETGRWHIVTKEDLGTDESKPKVELLDEIEQLVTTRGYAHAAELAELLRRDVEDVETELRKGEQRGSLMRDRRGGWHVPKR